MTVRRSLALLATALLFATPAGADLFSYVGRRDPETRWRKASEESAGGERVIVLELVSQVWRGSSWKHEVRVVQPETEAPSDVVLLVVSGAPAGWRRFDYERRLAALSGSPVAVLSDVPNQPLFFGRREDDLLAHTFAEYLKTGDEDWPLLFPMTKAAIEAMDAVAELSAKEWGRPVERFIVTGASKRGWTSWLAAAADPRVAGVVPIVFDNLGFGPQMRHQFAVWGEYSGELGDYTSRRLQEQMETPRGAKLVSMVDPLALRDRLGRAWKLVVNGTNDPYWPVDSLRFYWDQLEGEKSVRYVPNGNHGIAQDDRVAAATVAFVRRVAAGKPMPRLKLVRARGGRLARIVSDERPDAARLWIARSATKDFRRSAFESLAARRNGDALTLEIEASGAGKSLALFAEADYLESEHRFSLSTPVEVEEGAAAVAK